MDNMPMMDQGNQGLEAVKAKSFILVAVVGGIMLAPAIACLVVATHYNEEYTSCTGSYTVDLVTFLEVAGGIQITFGGLAILCGICSVMMEFPNGCAQGNCCVGLFYLIWAAIGLYMYCNQMSHACQEDTIAEMVLAWSIIQYAMIPVICCFVCCMACILGTAVAAIGMSQAAAAMDEEQSEPLNPNGQSAEEKAADEQPAEAKPDENAQV